MNDSLSQANKVTTRSLASMAIIDPESLPLGTPPDFSFFYIDIASTANGRLSPGDAEIRYRDAPSRARRVVRNGDVLMATVRPNLKAFAYCDLPRGNYIASTGFAVLRALDGNDPKYILYAILADPVSQQIASYAVGSNYPAINSADVKRLQIPWFEPAVQRRVAKILSTLDETIEHTEALIAKYQEVKAGLMRDLFTRGVMPDGTLRPSRDKAPHLYKESPLGWIPKEWELTNLGRLADIVSGVTLGTANELIRGIEVPYLRVANVQDGYLDLSEVKRIRVSQAQLDKLQLRKGDVLMNEGGDFDKLGRGTVWNEEVTPCIHQNHVFRVRARGTALRPCYLAYWSQSEFGRTYFLVSSKQSTNLASINSTQLHRFPVAIPSYDEQFLIESRIAGMNRLIDSHAVSNAKLVLMKFSLMHDLLTGRVRVKTAEPIAA